MSNVGPKLLESAALKTAFVAAGAALVLIAAGVSPVIVGCAAGTKDAKNWSSVCPVETI